jgi:RNA polymerase sigma-70 factor (ECF subfamily)
MAIHPNEISTDALLEQAGWLSALARRLVRDPAEADDIAQETMLAALSTGKPAPRRWLAHVARNIARARARSRSARVHRETSREGPAPVPSSADLAEKFEAQRLLVEAVRNLDEPSRTTILLHYWEHKTSDEIAAIQGVAPGTVRWRLHQAVDALRQRLDAQHGGDRRAWSVLITPLVKSGSGTAIATTSVLTGVLSMKLLLQACVAVAALLVVGAGVWLVRKPSELGAVPLPSNDTAVVQLEDPGKVAPTATMLEDAREAQRTPEPRTVDERKTAQQPTAARLEARILDEHSRPIRGARVSLAQKMTTTAVADGTGRVALEVTEFTTRAPTRFRVTATARVARTVSATLQPGQVTHLGDVVLQPGGVVSGRIVDERGAPIVGASVGIDRPDAPPNELSSHAASRYVGDPSAESTADGSYRIDGVPIGKCRVFAFSPANQTGHSDPIEVVHGLETPGVDIALSALPSDQLVRGVVLDPEGKPVPGATVNFEYLTSEDSSIAGSFLTDAAGRFDEVVEPGTKVKLLAHDEKDRWSDSEGVETQPSEKDIVLRFRSAQWVEVAVTNAEGAPVEDCLISFQSVPRQWEPIPNVEAHHPGGTVKMMVPSSRFMIEVEAHGYAKAELGPFEPASVSARVDVVLQSAHGIRGRVVSASGPVAKARVRLFARAAGRVMHNGFAVNVDPHSRDDVRTGDDGTFLLSPRGVGQWIVRADVEGYAPTERRLVGFDAERGAEGVELIVSAGGAIEGRVLPGPGREAVGTIVAVSRGDGFAETQRVGTDGAFSFTHLMPGRWMVSQRNEELNPTSSSMSWSSNAEVELPWNCEVIEGRTTRFDLAAEAAPSCTLQGRIKVQSATLGTWNAQFANEPGAPKPVVLDADGAFELGRSEPGPARLLLTAVSGTFEGTRIMAPIRLDVGETNWSTNVLAATLSLRKPGAGSAAPLAFVVVRPDGTTVVTPLPDEGDVDVVVPAGEGRVLRLDPTALKGADPRDWTGGVAVKVEPDETTTVERP